MVAPVVDYGALFCFSDQEVEKVQFKVYRYFLGVGRKHPLAALFGDMCWMPSKCRHKLQAVLFGVKPLKMDQDRLCSKMLRECTELTNFHQTNCWVSQVKEILNECNLSVWRKSHIGLSVKEVNEVITSCLFRVERDKWENNIQTKPKLRLYRLLKSEYKDEPYIQVQ